MTQNEAAIKGNIYSVTWQSDAAHGHFSRQFRIIANDVLDAMEATRPRHGTGEVDECYACIAANLLWAGIVIRVSEVITKHVLNADTDPYHDDAFKKQLAG